MNAMSTERRRHRTRCAHQSSLIGRDGHNHLDAEELHRRSMAFQVLLEQAAESGQAVHRDPRTSERGNHGQ